MPSNALKEMLSRRKDRSIATILSYKDEVMDEFLPSDVSFEFRKLVLDQLNDLYDFSLDVLRSVEGNSMTINEEYVDRLEAALTRAEDMVRAESSS